MDKSHPKVNKILDQIVANQIHGAQKAIKKLREKPEKGMSTSDLAVLSLLSAYCKAKAFKFASARSELRNFLAVSADVDFNAQLVRSAGGKMTFANPDYESKPAAWKALFRSGRETATALRAAAQQWLGELK